MTDSVVERMARAICRTHWGHDTDWRAYERDARAALEAMREPTREMEHAGAQAAEREVYSAHGEGVMSIGGERAIWTAMIDSALSE